MAEVTTVARPVGIVAKTARRAAFSLTIAIGVVLLLSFVRGSMFPLVLSTIAVGLSATAAFALFELWPPRLPSWLQRWVLQVLAVGLTVPITMVVLYRSSHPPGAPSLLDDNDQVHLLFAAIIVAPWTALAAIIRQKEAFAHHQKLAFTLERSELERQAADARLHLLQAQVAPHFLFNTLANVQALVDAGSPHASQVLRSLVRYLRAAVPLLDEPTATVERELQLVRPYLELMQMRMPDRLQYAMNVDPHALKLRCPPTTLLTLVENAVRHGIDPSEEGGRIDVEVARRGERCLVRVSDTGVGLRPAATGLGTGLTTLRERLRLVFGDAAQLRLTSGTPGGVVVEIDMPAHP